MKSEIRIPLLCLGLNSADMNMYVTIIYIKFWIPITQKVSSISFKSVFICQELAVPVLDHDINEMM